MARGFFPFGPLVCVCRLYSSNNFLVFFAKHILHLKDFSGSTEPRILKFGTNVGYNFLYCVREKQLPPFHHSLYLSIFLSPQ